jgi:hypothetical protein
MAALCVDCGHLGSERIVGDSEKGSARIRCAVLIPSLDGKRRLLRYDHSAGAHEFAVVAIGPARVDSTRSC